MWHALGVGMPSANEAVPNQVRIRYLSLASGSVEFQPPP